MAGLDESLRPELSVCTVVDFYRGYCVLGEEVDSTSALDGCFVVEEGWLRYGIAGTT